MPLKLSPTQLAFNARGDGKFSLPFQEQIDFMIQKLNLPTEQHNDILKSAHDRAFVVAGAANADLLTDLHDAVNKAIADGKSIGWFRKEFAAIVQKHGWEGWTGSETKAGRDWRTRVIYSTNLQASYSAGRYAQAMHPDVLKSHPYWKYLHNDNVAQSRKLHKEWGDKPVVLRYDDPWWSTHRPPNGIGCKCRFEPVTADEYTGDAAPENGTYTKIDRFGETHTIPNGIDFGWDYGPGAKTDVSLRTLVQDKLIRYKPAITKALTRDVNRYINAHETASVFVDRVIADKSIQEPAWLGFVESPEKLTAALNIDTTSYLVLLPSDTVRHVTKHHANDGKGQRPARATDYDNVWRVLAEGDVKPTSASSTGASRLIATLIIGGETFRCVFEVMGKKLRAIALTTLVIKTK